LSEQRKETTLSERNNTDGDIPTFEPQAAEWAQTVLIQSLIVQLISTKIMTVEQAQMVFDIALGRTDRERQRAPDASRFISHVHDNMKWDDYYLWSAQDNANNPDRN
jgi:hypothetical protein